MTGLVPRSCSSLRNSALSEALSPSMRFDGFTLRIRRSATGQSCASPPVNRMAMRRPLASASVGSSCCALRASGQQPASAPPFSARGRAVRFDVCGVDHLRVRRSTVAGELPEQGFPYAAPRPPSEAIVDRRGRPVSLGTIGPATAAFQHMYNAADNAAIVLPLDTAHIGWQVRFDPLPLLIAQPK